MGDEGVLSPLGARLSLVSWNITCRCNLHCAHCYLDAPQAPHPQELTTQEGLALLGQIAATGPGAMVVFSGGEPLLRPDLLTLARHGAGQGLRVVIGTNGLALNASVAHSLKKAGVAGVGISLDSPEPSYHDAFRGMAGAWRGAVRAIAACRQAGLDFQVQMTVTPGNHHQVPQMVQLAEELGARAFNLFFLVCTGRGQQLTDISPRDYEATLAYLADCSSPIMVRARCAPHFFRVARARGKDNGGQASAGCLAATSYCRITCQGELTPCPYLPLSVGNVREKSFLHLWNHSPLFQAFREASIGGKCGHCQYLGPCRGCRARAYAITGDLWGEDPQCSYQPSPGEAPARSPAWSPEASQRLAKAPAFLRPLVQARVEDYARSHGLALITPSLLEELRGRIPASRAPRAKE